jgi:hypothetical protein
VALDLGFDTIGNATLIAYDGTPVVATDPWLDGDAYFGSWRLSHAIPDEQREAIFAAPYIWLSHGHPDHMHMPSLQQLRDKTILIPDHVGGRIRDFLAGEGFRVEVLRDRQWRSLSPRVRVCCLADFNQDASLLVDIDGTLIVDANDASERGWADVVRRATRAAAPTFLLALSGYGDADMINYFDEVGERILPYAAKKIPPGPAIDARMQRLGARFFIPFASHHCYQRADSVWANDYITRPEEHRLGFASTEREMLPAFVRYDCRDESVTELNPPAPPIVVHEPEEFGDDWSEPFTPEDLELARRYFGAITTLRGKVDEICFLVAGTEHRVPIGTGSGRSVTFEAPRASLTEAMRWEFFDDLLIGNFMRTTLHGNWPNGTLNPTFTAPVTKYADNGGAKTPEELRAYLREYRRRAGLSYYRYRLSEQRDSVIRAAAARTRAGVKEGSFAHRVGKSAYSRVRRGG